MAAGSKGNSTIIFVDSLIEMGSVELPEQIRAEVFESATEEEILF